LRELGVSQSDVVWLRQSYMRHVRHLCSIVTAAVKTWRRWNQQVYNTICRFALGIDHTPAVLTSVHI